MPEELKKDRTASREGQEIFRPYARLISILGDQLITSKWVGIIELVKNCYDADASNVSVRFVDFDIPGKTPYIEIEDDGDGMTLDTVLNVWMKPGTPNKLNKKKDLSDDVRFTRKGRRMQGDKGIGRFASYKLGNAIRLATKSASDREVVVTIDFARFSQNDEFGNTEKVPDLYLDEISNHWKENETPIFIKNEEAKGTLIHIESLRNDWKIEDIRRLQVAFQRLIAPIIPGLEEFIKRDFTVQIEWNGVPRSSENLTLENVIELAPFSFSGSVSEVGVLKYSYRHHNKKDEGTIDFFDASDAVNFDIWNLRDFREQFLKTVERSEQILIKKADGSIVKSNSVRKSRNAKCGPFSFYFYAFDWRHKEGISKEQEAFIKDNSVFVYRDFARVFPYGEKGIDWLDLSKNRAESKAGDYFSYNDLLGFVFITQDENSLLQDQASREGLVDIDGALSDFKAMIQASLKILKVFVDRDKHSDKEKREKAYRAAIDNYSIAFKDFEAEVKDLDNVALMGKAKHFLSSADVLVKQYESRIQITQELAGLGMAIERSSHDVSNLIGTLRFQTDDLLDKLERGKLSPPTLKRFLLSLNDALTVLVDEMQVIRPLFRYNRTVFKEISIRDALERIQRFYQSDFNKGISFQLIGDGDITLTSTLGSILQVFLNLFDNAIYWLNQSNSRPKQLRVQINQERRQVIVADNGKGIPEDLAEVVFFEFYTTKAENGRGLGLYIAREFLTRMSSTITVIVDDEKKILPGANFLIQFGADE